MFTTSQVSIAILLGLLFEQYGFIPEAGLQKIENWLGPHQNWLQSAFSKVRQKSRIDTHFHLFFYIILFFMHL